MTLATTATPRNAAPAPTCPVSTLAAEYHALTRRYDELDQLGLSHTKDTRRELDAIDIARDALREAASFFVPESAAGAAFLMAQLSGAADILRNCTMNEEREAELHARIDRCTYAVFNYLRSVGGVLPSLIEDYDIPRRLSPLPKDAAFAASADAAGAALQ